MISIGEKGGKKAPADFVPSSIRLLGECKLSSLVNICDYVPSGSRAENIRQVQGLLLLDTKSTELMEIAACLNTTAVLL